MTKYHIIDYKDTVFYIDGSLRDIYIKQTNKKDWEYLIRFLQNSIYNVQFILEGEKISIPEDIEDIFHQQQPFLLSIDQGQLSLNSHFFTEDEIEFDLDPDLMNNDHQLARLVDFIHAIGQLLKKEVFLTPENMPEYPLFHFDPLTNTDMWIPHV